LPRRARVWRETLDRLEGLEVRERDTSKPDALEHWSAGMPQEGAPRPQTQDAVTDFLERYARAREEQADKLFREIIEIADDAGRFRLATSPASTGSAPVSKTIGVVWRFVHRLAENRDDRLPELAADLVRRRVAAYAVMFGRSTLQAAYSQQE
jgi:hypothetical protein